MFLLCERCICLAVKCIYWIYWNIFHSFNINHTQIRIVRAPSPSSDYYCYYYFFWLYLIFVEHIIRSRTRSSEYSCGNSNIKQFAQSGSTSVPCSECLRTRKNRKRQNPAKFLKITKHTAFVATKSRRNDTDSRQEITIKIDSKQKKQFFSSSSVVYCFWFFGLRVCMCVIRVFARTVRG